MKGRDELPEDHGWEGILTWVAEDALKKREPNVVATLDIQVAEQRVDGYRFTPTHRSVPTVGKASGRSTASRGCSPTSSATTSST